MRLRSRWRMVSRSTATDFMRFLKSLRSSNGSASVMIEAPTAIAVIAEVMNWGERR